ncbi:hypothetical protein M378DRAFT_160850, partial [Amanita muscaria Koide BX008]
DSESQNVPSSNLDSHPSFTPLTTGEYAQASSPMRRSRECITRETKFYKRRSVIPGLYLLTRKKKMQSLVICYRYVYHPTSPAKMAMYQK